jgi:hypothetical protein
MQLPEMQVSTPGAQMFPQLPQLKSSVLALVQIMPASEVQKVSVFRSHRHLPPKHVVISVGQRLPQPPQFRLSACSVVQMVPPSWVGHGK